MLYYNSYSCCLVDGKDAEETISLLSDTEQYVYGLRTGEILRKIHWIPAPELKRLYVLKEEQGNGYGSMLFETALNYARESKFHKICTDTRNDRDASQHLMRKHGFDEVSRYNDNQFAELFFELKL